MDFLGEEEKGNSTKTRESLSDDAKPPNSATLDSPTGMARLSDLQIYPYGSFRNDRIIPTLASS
ncbi:hypothetical protein PanWU01x14_220690 [Parasponia andersonii]|uniref:Uncharacterized protein n=1 Tax=Parasponia andersonii TaxID=3476 RepID=A0A2P5BPW2_PARAD|nr:hypothetical protein PanWU01x14_220690 [Parasponia andersonii]